MGSYYDIYKALTQSVIDINLDIPIAYENADFDPSDVTDYTTDNAGYSISDTMINVISGEKEIFAGSEISFSGDANKYTVVSGTVGDGVVTIAAPGLLQAIPASITGVTAHIDRFLDITDVSGDKIPIAKDILDEATGIYQLSVYTKSGISVKKSLETVDLIVNEYPFNREFTNGVQTITILSASRNEGRNINGWYIIDISIDYKSDFQR